MGQKESNLRRIEQFVNGDPQYNFGGEAPGFLSYPTPTPSITSTPTLTQTIGFNPTQTPTLSNTPTLTATPTLTYTPTQTPTITSTQTPSPTLTLTTSPTPTKTPIYSAPTEIIITGTTGQYIGFKGVYTPTGVKYSQKVFPQSTYRLYCSSLYGNYSFCFIDNPVEAQNSDWRRTIVRFVDNSGAASYNFVWWQYLTPYTNYPCNQDLELEYYRINVAIPTRSYGGVAYPAPGTYISTYGQYTCIWN